jgi:predicted Ser/Thr protein kinase
MIKIGEKLGNFLIQAEIGRGGMGTIYFAVDTMLNREVALKVVHPQLADNEQLMERFKIEAMTQARLNHPNIVMIFSFNRIEDEYVIAMEYVEGRSLKELLKEKKQLHPVEAVEIVTQVAEGLRYAHSHNVIHRDIKPANILIGKDGKVKISDFGIAKIFGAQGLTKTGMLVGTPWYTSPEQIVGKSIDFRSDLYSLGITFYEVLTGRVPFDSETNSEFQIQKAHLETPPPRPSIYNPEIGIKLERIILLALQKKVEKRFQNARDMIDELHKVRSDMTKAGLTTTTYQEVTQKIVAPQKKGRRFLLTPVKVLAFLILLLAGVVLFVFLTGKSGMDEGRGGPVGTTLAQQGESKGPDAAGGEGSAAEVKSDGLVQITAGQVHGANADADKVAGGKAGLSGENGPVEGAARQMPGPGQEKADADKASPDGAADAMDSQARKKEPEKSTTEATPKQVEELRPPDRAISTDRLGSLDDELTRLRGFMEARNFMAANRLADALIRSGAESKALPMLGKVKFSLNQFAAAEKLWARALQENLLVSLEMVHLHDGLEDVCLGQLKFKKKIILFNSNTRGDHSLALIAGNIQGVALGDDLRITVTGAVGGQTIYENFMVASKIGKLDKERFLVNFINQYVL